MKKIILIILVCFAPFITFASSVFEDSFEYANHDMTVPIGWICNDSSWLCGHLDKDHNRTAHTGEWYAFTNDDDAWMFMPLWIGSELRYRFTSWVISDGTYELEFWAGTEGNVEHMSQQLFSITVNSGNYDEISEYVESITADFSYFGIRALASEGAYHLTIDDIQVDMVLKYEFTATPSISETSLYPGQEVIFRFDVHNLGYEPIDVIFFPSHDYFTDIHFTVEGTQCTTFHLEPDETKQVITEATLLPTVLPGTQCFLDVLMDLDCSCASALATLWVNVLDPDGIEEQEGFNDIQHVEIYDLTGKKVDASHLKPGIYLERTVSTKGISTRKFVKQ